MSNVTKFPGNKTSPREFLEELLGHADNIKHVSVIVTWDNDRTAVDWTTQPLIQLVFNSSIFEREVQKQMSAHEE